MHTSFLQSSKATALTLALVSLLFTLIVTPVERAQANSYVSAGTSESSSGHTSTQNASKGLGGNAYIPASGVGHSAVTPQSSDSSLKARLDAALKQIASLQERIAKGGKGDVLKDRESMKECMSLTRTFRKGATDATTGGEVSRLQSFLAKDKTLYPEGSVTGFYGEATEKAVQRFQSKNGIVKSGDAHTTGFGSIGGETRMALGKVCGNKATSTASTSTKAYTLDDVKSVTAKKVDPIPNAIDDEYTLYAITLKNGTVYEVKRGFAGPGVFEKAIKDTGYTGDIAKLIAKAKLTELRTYTITDVKKVVLIEAGQGLSYAPHRSGSKATIALRSFFVITFTDGQLRKVAYDSASTAITEANLKRAGFVGTVAELKAKAVKTTHAEDGAPEIETIDSTSGAVLGAEASSADVLLDEIFERLDALSLLIE